MIKTNNFRKKLFKKRGKSMTLQEFISEKEKINFILVEDDS